MLGKFDDAENDYKEGLRIIKTLFTTPSPKISKIQCLHLVTMLFRVIKNQDGNVSQKAERG
jgi:hypothetical protein